MKEEFNWSVFDNWEIHFKRIDWAVFDNLEDMARESLKKPIKNLINILKKSSSDLSWLEGEPAFHDWNNFRPIKINREEDWSNWLGHLISFSNGSFNSYLFSDSKNMIKDFNQPEVVWEYYMPGYRADIVIKWKSKVFTHVEVKVGDTSLDKTYDTSLNLRRAIEYDNSKWSDYILILPDQIEDWENCKDRNSDKTEFKKIDIKSMDWMHVSKSLRVSLYKQHESTYWCSWAYALCGTIEQKLLNMPTFNFLSKELNKPKTVNIRIGDYYKFIKEALSEKY